MYIIPFLPQGLENGVLMSLFTVYILPFILSAIPSPLSGIARQILNKILVIKIFGFTITVGAGTIIGYLFF